MKKLSIFALVLALTGVLCACNRGSTTADDTTGMTMPSVITTIPSTEDKDQGNNFQPDDDGFIGQTETTSPTEESQAPRHKGRMRLR